MTKWLMRTGKSKAKAELIIAQADPSNVRPEFVRQTRILENAMDGQAMDEFDGCKTTTNERVVDVDQVSVS